MLQNILKLFFCFLIFIATALASLDDVSRLLNTPDFTKTHKNIPNSGAGYCGPSAVSNSIMYLVKKGKLDKILNKTSNTPLQQWELVILLGSNRYMKTESEGGTSPASLIAGLERFMSAHAKSKYRISYSGTSEVPKKYLKDNRPKVAGIVDIQETLKSDSVGWINAGWYSKGKKIGSSWMTVVGLKGDDSRKTLVLHDPNPRSGEAATHEEVVLERFKRENGDVAFKLGKGMHIKEDADTALLDGVVRLSI